MEDFQLVLLNDKVCKNFFPYQCVHIEMQMCISAVLCWRIYVFVIVWLRVRVGTWVPLVSSHLSNNHVTLISLNFSLSSNPLAWATLTALFPSSRPRVQKREKNFHFSCSQLFNAFQMDLVDQFVIVVLPEKRDIFSVFSFTKVFT